MAAAASAAVPGVTAAPPAGRLRRVDCTDPGLQRRRRGKGFEILDGEGRRVTDPQTLGRIDALAIPPAWEDVWICPHPRGHIQATGVDQRGRKQYLYHPDWRRRRDLAKFEDMIAFARALPALRERVEADLRRGDLSHDHVLAVATRLLDRGFFRIGSEDYAVTNETYGLATLHKRHVRVNGDTLVFDYPAKHGKRQLKAVVDPEVARCIEKLKRRRGGSPELLAYKAGGRWRDIRSNDINAYLKAQTGLDVSAKDFRTWGATVLAAVALAVAEEAPATKTARKRVKARAVREVAHYLGNTPAVARASYIDPRVFERFDEGRTVRPALHRIPEGEDVAIQGPVEEAVLELLDG